MKNTVAPSIPNGNLSKQPSFELHFSQLCYSIKTPAHKSDNQILIDTCGNFQAGRLTAILGQSGAGKSSLLNILAGFK